MEDGEHYLAHVSCQTLQRLEGKTWDALMLCGPGHPNELVTCVVQAVSQQYECSDYDTDEIFLHPLLYECLSQTTRLARDHTPAASTRGNKLLFEQDHRQKWLDCEISPYPYTPEAIYNEDEAIVCKVGKVKTVPLPAGACIVLECLEPPISPYTASNLSGGGSDSSRWCRKLAGRIVAPKSLSLLSSNGDMRIGLVQDIRIQGDDLSSEPVAYRVGSQLDSFRVEIIPNQKHSQMLGYSNMSTPLNTSKQDWWDQDDCPGYERLVDSLVSLLRLKMATTQSTRAAAPTGILITGCSGVGKTRLASCAMHQIAHQCQVHWVSVQDLLVRASWATPDDLLQMLEPPTTTLRNACVLVLDDLDAIRDNELRDGESSLHDMERRLVCNSITQATEELVSSGTGMIVGIAESSSGLPSQLVKIGQLEKEIEMPPPSQQQRESILLLLLQQAQISSTNCDIWAPLLASATAGCVAADLEGLCSNAWTRAMADADSSTVPPSWEHLSYAAQNCIPSQLAALDVTKSANIFDRCSKDDWPKIHAQSWKNLAGYDGMKKRIYRTVVVPWRRAMLKGSESGSFSQTPFSISPPRGVLFHGPTGCGKTLAASCLGVSLGLPMIKVRASDVLDKWLGGSEAAVRSLFARARSAAPVILHLDEIDAIASNRSQDGDTVDVMSRLLSTLLNEMDGVSSRQSRVLVIACTNRLESLDSALLRPGRLEEHVELVKPSAEDAEQILRLGFGRAKLDDCVDLHSIACKLVEVQASGAQLEGVGREAVLRWIREAKNESPLSQKHIEEAMGALHLQ